MRVSRHAIVALGAAALLGGSPATAEAWRPDVRSARAYAESRAGEVTFAVRTPRAFYGHRADTQVPSASVVKAMLLVSYLNREVGRGKLTGYDRSLLGPMIRRSDNITATIVRNTVGNEGLIALARRVGMRSFATAPSWGSSLITARDQARFFIQIDRVVPRRHREYALRLLRTVVSGQRWGVARARPRGWSLHFKGGWGSGSGAVNHQVALLLRGERRVSLAVTTYSNPSHDYGSRTIRDVSRRLLRGLAAR